ncbi:MAG: hypothetical protein CMJ58_19835 [Planctomycetaceae bacterium]|nr:hypothetical protein [Planctomycetaceae bacterium]
MTFEFPAHDVADRAVLDAAAAWLRRADADELAGDWPRRLAVRQGTDVATAALYLSVRQSDRCLDLTTGAGVARPVEMGATAIPLHVAVAPGAFYREHPGTGADGAAVRSAAETLGCRTSLIRTPSIGTLALNARVILDWLAQQPPEPVVIVSLSKGGADMKCALAAPDAAQVFRHVVAWINVGGITEGSGMASWLFDHPAATMIYRCLFWRRGRDFQFVRDLPRRIGGPLDFTPDVPNHMTVIHVVGFPLRRHIQLRATRAWHRRLAKWGPNDGAAVLYDACRLPGRIVPVWGVDHFAQDRLDLGQLAAKVLGWLATRGQRDSSAGRPESERTSLGAAL